MLKRFITDTRGATAVEYALICGLIFLGIISGVSALGNSTSAQFDTIANSM